MATCRRLAPAILGSTLAILALVAIGWLAVPCDGAELRGPSEQTLVPCAVPSAPTTLCPGEGEPQPGGPSHDAGRHPPAVATPEAPFREALGLAAPCRPGSDESRCRAARDFLRGNGQADAAGARA